MTSAKTSSWSVAGASAVGTSHVESGAPCQDRFAFEVALCYGGSEALVAVVSDGASSAACAELGAEITCATLLRRAKDAVAISTASTAISDALVHAWFSELREQIRKLALGNGQTPRDFSATGLLVMAMGDATICAQVGDGAILLRPIDQQDSQVAFWPERGQGDATFFATSDRDVEHIRIRRFAPILSMMLFSDGLQELMLDETNQSVCKEFVDEFLRGQDLESFLQSEYVNARTNDDKTLIVGSRV